MKRVNTSFSVIVTSQEESEHFFEGNTLCMTGYNYTKRSVCTLFMAGYNYTNKCLLSSWLVTIPLKESEHFL
jgi:hypothetical protein